MDSHTLWTMNIRKVEFLLNSVDPRLHFVEGDIVEALNVLYDNAHNEEIDFDEFLYQLALLHKVNLHRDNCVDPMGRNETSPPPARNIPSRLTATPSGEWKRSVGVGDRQTNRQTDKHR